MDETKALEVDPTLTGQDLPTGNESNSKDTPRNITPEEHQKGIEDAIAQYGDKVKREKIDPIVKERDELKSQAEQAQKEAQEATVTLEETRGRITDLEADLEQAISDDADQKDIQKIKRDLRDERDKARKEAQEERNSIAELKKTTEAERLEWAGTVAEAQAYKFHGELAKVVDEYDGDTAANFTKLKNACEKAGVKTKEGAEAIAETFLTKKVSEPDLLEDSGVTTGGGTDLSQMSPRELIKHGLKTGK